MSTPQTFLNGRVALYAGDCREIVASLPDASIDSCVSDPPYALVSISKRFGKPGSAPAVHGKDGLYARASAGFMGKAWDTGDVAFDPTFWADVLRVLKPGAHLVAFGGTRSYHRLACAIEDAGFEIRDQLAWVYGSGFPKSHNVSKAFDKAAGVEREVIGTVRSGIARSTRKGGELIGAQVFEELKQSPITAPSSEEAKQWEGWGTALKPAWEPIVLARKSLVGTVAANLLKHGTGAINIDSCRVGDNGGCAGAGAGAGAVVFGDGLNGTFAKPVPGLGRWPANIIQDGSEEVLAAFPEAPGQQREVTGAERAHRTSNTYGDFGSSRDGFTPRSDSGSAARFFYSAKADANDRIGSRHPTVKPVDLMQWLCRLITPPGGCVLDPFAGTGTTGEAAWREGFSAVLIKRESEYRADIARRMELAQAGPATRTAERVKARFGDVHAGPLFGSAAE